MFSFHGSCPSAAPRTIQCQSRASRSRRRTGVAGFDATAARTHGSRLRACIHSRPFGQIGADRSSISAPEDGPEHAACRTASSSDGSEAADIDDERFPARQSAASFYILGIRGEDALVMSPRLFITAQRIQGMPQDPRFPYPRGTLLEKALRTRDRIAITLQAKVQHRTLMKSRRPTGLFVQQRVQFR
jgi:hypothetical protein